MAMTGAMLALVISAVATAQAPPERVPDLWYARLPLDPYAATDPAEFFAVSGEAFFIAPQRLREAWPAWRNAAPDSRDTRP